MSDTNAPIEASGIQRAPLMRKWVLKMVAFIAVLFGFGCWALYDALWLYPERQRDYASFKEYDYLVLARDAGGAQLDRVGITDPRAELERLRKLERESGALTGLDAARAAWLEGLAVINHLDGPRYTDIPRQGVTDARARLAELEARWMTASGEKRKSPKPLTRWDIPSQWAILVVCWGIMAYMLGLLAKTAGQKFSWDPAQQRLTLPDGASLVPADIDDFDKRKWDKFLIFLKIRPGHEKLGGKELKLDLYRHDRLEGWVLEMEKTRFPERAAEAQKADEQKQAQPAEPQPGTAQA